MLFRRRKPADFWERARTVFWPRTSFRRSIQYLVKRVLRLTATPHAIAAGVAAGTFASFTPFIGFHFVIAFALAYIIAGNMAAAAFGTAVGNPLTFPFIWSATFELGHLIQHGLRPETSVPMALIRNLMHLDIRHLWRPLLEPMLIGSLPIGICAALVAYGLTRWGTTTFQHRRRNRLARKAKRAGTKVVSATAGS
jgi:uncharacterized protein (DUF2062 family)